MARAGVWKQLVPETRVHHGYVQEASVYCSSLTLSSFATIPEFGFMKPTRSQESPCHYCYWIINGHRFHDFYVVPYHCPTSGLLQNPSQTATFRFDHLSDRIFFSIFLDRSLCDYIALFIRNLIQLQIKLTYSPCQ